MDLSAWQMLKKAKAALVLANEDGEIIFWNEGSEEVFGYTEEEILGKQISLLLPNKYHDLISREKSATYGKDDEVYGVRKNEVEFPCEIVFLCYNEGNKRVLVAFIYDLSHGIMGALRKVTHKLETIDQRLNTLENRIAGL